MKYANSLLVGAAVLALAGCNRPAAIPNLSDSGSTAAIAPSASTPPPASGATAGEIPDAKPGLYTPSTAVAQGQAASPSASTALAATTLTAAPAAPAANCHCPTPAPVVRCAAPRAVRHVRRLRRHVRRAYVRDYAPPPQSAVAYHAAEAVTETHASYSSASTGVSAGGWSAYRPSYAHSYTVQQMGGDLGRSRAERRVRCPW